MLVVREDHAGLPRELIRESFGLKRVQVIYAADEYCEPLGSVRARRFQELHDQRQVSSLPETKDASPKFLIAVRHPNQS